MQIGPGLSLVHLAVFIGIYLLGLLEGWNLSHVYDVSDPDYARVYLHPAVLVNGKVSQWVGLSVVGPY
ncbi:MAG: hypothetical protein FJ320_07470 [SAR202 cluster bacterium]|nr:hypothetical protein [SAR202 cluster bacterium]